MTAAYRIVVAERKDIATVNVVCVCGSKISLEAATANIPESCGSCGKTYEEHTRSALTALSRFHREASVAEKLADGENIFQFEIRQNE